MQKLASFDLEIAKELPDRQCPKCLSENTMTHGKMAMCTDCGNTGNIHEFRSDWKNHRPLGVTCADVMFSDTRKIEDFWARGKLNKTQSRNLVVDILEWSSEYTFVTWNGLSFDFDVLAEESGMHKECAELALNHIDLMFIVVTLHGHFLGLDKAAKGANIQGKLHDVTLSDGTKLDDMSGGKAPGLWKAGEYQAVLDYLADDVRSTLELAEWIRDNKKIQWLSDKQKKMGYTDVLQVPKKFRQIIHVPKLYTVRECLELNPVLPRWVTEPVERKSMMEWIK